MISSKHILKYLPFLVIITGFFVAVLAAGAVQAQEPQPQAPSDNEVNAIAKQLYCPVCENIPLDVCPTQACAQWRELIREKLAAGWSEDEIKTYFVNQYGDRVLGSPPASGLHWAVYILPPLAILVGIYILYRALRAWRKSPEAVAAGEQQASQVDDDYVARLEEELRQR